MEIISRKEKIKDGEAILEEGTWAYYAYVLKAGKAKVFKNIDGKPVLLGTLNQGDIFGEVAFLGGAKRTASVIADGDVEVDMIPRDSFFDALNQLPRGLRSKLNALVSDLTFMDEVRGRLMAFLHELQNVRAKMIDLKSFEREVENMPELLRRVVIAFAKRLNASVEGCTELGAQAEETVKVIDSLSLPLTK
ncbi:MAG TPA: cyclic nucleotide-binding domain-containing protein [Candidatus Methylomirabilis sp.]|nr:cyclic nucleotide-binding domain-containing protein [Candidatus Methylomirabilis sp.]